MRILCLSLMIVFISCRSQRYYVVRHAEKAIITKDTAMFSSANPPLSEPGQVRAFVLRDELRKRNIDHIFSTNFHRTINTAKPLSEERKDVPIQLYSSSKDSLAAFISRLKEIRNDNVLIVGHSNTVDDIVNSLTGEKHIKSDLSEAVYDNMYIITRKKDRWIFTERKYGYPSNPEK